MKEKNELDEYLREVIKNDEKCKNCMLKHEDNVCFFAYECIKNNHNHFKLERKGENKECEYYDSEAETCRRSESEFDELNNLYYGMTDSMQKAVKDIMLVANGKEIEE